MSSAFRTAEFGSDSPPQAGPDVIVSLFSSGVSTSYVRIKDVNFLTTGGLLYFAFNVVCRRRKLIILLFRTFVSVLVFIIFCKVQVRRSYIRLNC